MTCQEFRGTFSLTLFWVFLLTMIAQQWTWNQKVRQKSVQHKWQRQRAIVHAPHVSFARIWLRLLADVLTALVDRVFRSVGSYRCGVFSRFELEAVEDVETWSWRLIEAIWSQLLPPILSAVNFRTTKKPRVQRYSQSILRVLFVGLSTQSAAFTCNLIECHQTAMLLSIKKLWTKTPLR